MEAKSFISNKLAAYKGELEAIDAEYLPRREAALATIAMTKKWLDELAMEVEVPVAQVVASEVVADDQVDREVELLKSLDVVSAIPEPVAEPIVEAVAPREVPAVRAMPRTYTEVVMERNPDSSRSNMQEPVKRPSENWVSARDLLPKVRQAS